MREFLKNYWVSIILILCTAAVLAVEIMLFPVGEEFFAFGYFVILLAIFLLALATDSCDDIAYTTFCVLSCIAPLPQMGVLMYWNPMIFWFPIISGGLLSCMGGLYFAYGVPKVLLLRQLQRGLYKDIMRDQKQFRLEHEAYLAKLKEYKAKQERRREKEAKRKKEAKKKRYSYQGKPVSHVRSKIIRIVDESGGYMIYLEQGNISYYIFKYWLKRKGKKMLAAPKIGDYATLYFSGEENSSVVACYIGGRCRYKANGFEEY